MTTLMRIALWVLIPSAVVVAASQIAFELFPSQWGGPNIGGGLILLMGVVGVLAGLVILVVAWCQRLLDRP